MEKRTALEDGGEEVWRYRWNAAGLLREVERPDGNLVRFAYDPFARRLHKEMLKPVSGGGYQRVSRVRFVWDGDVLAHQIRADAQAAGDPVVEERSYLFGDSGFLPTVATLRGSWHAIEADCVGTPQRAFDSRGAVVWSTSPHAWGVRRQPGDVDQAGLLAHPGQYCDDETGLAYQRWRYFDSETALFATPDPLGLDATENPWRYIPNAFGWLDPLGLAATKRGCEMTDAERVADRRKRRAERRELQSRQKNGQNPSGTGFRAQAKAEEAARQKRAQQEARERARRKAAETNRMANHSGRQRSVGHEDAEEHNRVAAGTGGTGAKR